LYCAAPARDVFRSTLLALQEHRMHHFTAHAIKRGNPATCSTTLQATLHGAPTSVVQVKTLQRYMKQALESQGVLHRTAVWLCNDSFTLMRCESKCMLTEAKLPGSGWQHRKPLNLSHATVAHTVIGEGC
jgi:hypothetical protein